MIGYVLSVNPGYLNVCAPDQESVIVLSEHLLLRG